MPPNREPSGGIPVQDTREKRRRKPSRDCCRMAKSSFLPRRNKGYFGQKVTKTLFGNSPIKTQIVVDTKGKIRHVSRSVPGNIHDKKLFDDSGVTLPDRAKGDLAYLGTNITIPHKSSKLHALTKTQTLFNVRHSRHRIIIEHVFALLKSYRILADRFRGHLSQYHHYFVIVCGLCNVAKI